MTSTEAVQIAPRSAAVARKLLVVGHPRGGTSLLAQYLDSLGLRTVTDTRQARDYPAGFNEHLPSLLFTKACERLRGQRDRLTEDSLIQREFLDIPSMRAMFDAAYEVFESPDVDFIKLPDHALALDFMHERFPHLHFLGVWRTPAEGIASFYHREFGRFPGVKGLFYAIGTWNMYARRLIDFHSRHPELIDIVGVDGLLARHGSLVALLRQRGFSVPSDHGIRDILKKPWGRSAGWIGRGLPLFEAVFRSLVPAHQQVYFDTKNHLRQLEVLST